MILARSEFFEGVSFLAEFQFDDVDHLGTVWYNGIVLINLSM